MKRLAPAVLMENGLAYTTKKFRKHVYLGEPQNLVRIFSELDAHEVAITNLNELTEDVLTTLESMSKGSYVPLHFSGGINSAQQAIRVTTLGFEKIGIEVRSIERDIPVISQVSKKIGSTATSATLTVARNKDHKYVIWDWKTRRETSLDLQRALAEITNSGCGEIKVTCVDLDGTRAGPDLELARLIRTSTFMPIVYQGGVGTLFDVEALWNLGVDCVSSGTMLSTYGPFNAALPHYPPDIDLVHRWK